MKALAYVTDLFFQAKLGATAKEAGTELHFIRSIYELFPALDRGCDLLILDLEAEGFDGPTLISQIHGKYPELRIVAFAPHVQKSALEASKRSGAESLPRSQFSANLVKILKGEA